MPNLQAKIKPFSVCNRRCWRKNHRQLSELTARYFQLSISSTTLITSLLQTCNLRPLQQLHAGFSILCHQNLPRNVFGHDRVQRSFHARLGSWPWKRKRRKRVVDLLLIWNSFLVRSVLFAEPGRRCIFSWHHSQRPRANRGPEIKIPHSGSEFSSSSSPCFGTSFWDFNP